MGIDWAAAGSMLSGIGTLAGAFAIIMAALLGRKAAEDFRDQKRAERQIEHAEKALAAAYRIESALSAIRSPLTTASESAESRSELESMPWFEKLGKAEKERTIQSNVFYQRIRHFQSDFDLAVEALPFLKAYFGTEAANSLRDLVNCRHTVRVYADAYARDTGHNQTSSRKIESYVWEGAAPGEEDPIAERTKTALQILEQTLLSITRKDDKRSFLALKNKAVT